MPSCTGLPSNSFFASAYASAMISFIRAASSADATSFLARASVAFFFSSNLAVALSYRKFA